MAWQVAREELQGQLVEISQKFAAARGYLSSIYGMVARRGQVLIYSHVTVGLKWCTPEDDERWSAGEDSESIFFGVLKKYFLTTKAPISKWVPLHAKLALPLTCWVLQSLVEAHPKGGLDRAHPKKGQWS